MSRHCAVTGAKPGFGHAVSHSGHRANRRFNVNVQRRTYWVPSLGRRVTLRLTPRAMRTIDHRGIESVIAQMRKEGKKF